MTLSEPVLGKWVNHEESNSANVRLTKKRSRATGLSSATNGKQVKMPKGFRRENPKSVALSK